MQFLSQLILRDNDSGLYHFAARILYGDRMACITKQPFSFAQYDGVEEKVEAVDEIRIKKRWIERRAASQHYTWAFTRLYIFQLVDAVQLVAVSPSKLLIAVGKHIFVCLVKSRTKWAVSWHVHNIRSSNVGQDMQQKEPYQWLSRFMKLLIW